MTTAALPAALQEAWDGTHARSMVGETALLVTVDPTGAPHVALLSAGEVAVTGPETIHFALWPASRTTSNLADGREGLLVMVHDGGLCRVTLRARRLTDIVRPWGTRACLQASVVAVADDRVGYATVTAPIAFKVRDETTLDRWEATVDALREAAGLASAAR